MTTLHSQNILTFVQNSNSVQDLIPILLSFPIDDVKQFICASLNTDFNSNDIKKLYYSSTSIENILGDDVTQLIVSFNTREESACINKSFQQHASKHQEKHLKQLIQSNNLNRNMQKSFYLKQIQYFQLQATKQSVCKSIQSLQKTRISLSQRIRQLNEKMHTISTELQENMTRVHSPLNHQKHETSFPSTFITGFNSIWIVHPYRTTLTPDEISLGYEGPIRHPTFAVDKAKSGDKILIYPGSYSSHVNMNCFCGRGYPCGCPHDLLFEIKDKELQIIGIREDGDDDDEYETVVFCDRTLGDYTFEIRNSNVLFENIIFERDQHNPIHRYSDEEDEDDEDTREYYRDMKCTYGTVGVTDNSNVWMNNCEITFNTNGIEVKEDCSLCAHDCVFVGRNEARSGIMASCYAQKVRVAECLFTQCGNANNKRRMDGECSCVHITVPYDEYEIEQRGGPSIELNCVSNVFRDNKGYPVAVKLEAYCSGDEVEAREIDLDLTVFECVLEQNELNGYNGIYTHQQNIDANVLYLNQI